MQAGAIGDRHNRDLGLPVQCAPPWARAGESVHLGGVIKFVIECQRCRVLQKLPEARTGISKPSRGKFNRESGEPGSNRCRKRGVHSAISKGAINVYDYAMQG